MTDLTGLLDALVRESGGGGESLETLEPQGIRGIALFLEDGSVAVFRVSFVQTEPQREGGAADE